jgi:hypothetical protein
MFLRINVWPNPIVQLNSKTPTRVGFLFQILLASVPQMYRYAL